MTIARWLICGGPSPIRINRCKSEVYGITIGITGTKLVRRSAELFIKQL
jgi:hypothetical protein